MSIKLSKSDWRLVGHKMGWLKQAHIEDLPTGEMDEVGARELYLFADNESALQNPKKSIITNLARKYAKGAYDKDLAIKLWTYLADSASKLYSKEMGGEFTPATRRETARMMEELHFSSVQDEAIDYKKRSSSTELKQIDKERNILTPNPKMVHTMLATRYQELTAYSEEDPSTALTEAEMAEGWHFCYSEWDDLLIHPRDVQEYALCSCGGQEEFVKWAKKELKKQVKAKYKKKLGIE